MALRRLNQSSSSSSSTVHMHMPTSCSSTAAQFRSCLASQFWRRQAFSTDAKRDLYQILGVPKTSNQDEIKKAFYTLSKRYHPDAVGSNEASTKKFQEIKEAYDTLKDEQKRREYDQLQQRGGPGYPYQRQQAAGTGPRNPDNPYHQQWQWQQKQQQRAAGRGPRPWWETEMDSEFYRSWQAMQSDPAFRQEARRQREQQARARAEAYERQQHYRWTRQANGWNPPQDEEDIKYEKERPQQPLWDDSQMAQARAIFMRVLTFYLVIFLIVALVGPLFDRPFEPILSRRANRDDQRRRLEEMMRRMP